MGPLGVFAIEAGTQFLGNQINAATGYNRQKKLQKLQIQGMKQMADYNKQTQLDIWNKTNFEAQKQHLKNAGLNPGLLYGMGGAGGATVGSSTGAGVTGAQAPMGEGMHLNGMGIQLAMLQAQKENIEADTKLKEADATKTAGVDTAEGQERIENIAQDTANAREQWNIQRLEQTYRNLINYKQQQTNEDQIKQIKSEAETAAESLEIIKNDRNISDETKNDKIKIIHQQAIGAAINNELQQFNIKATQAQITKWSNEIAQAWQNLDQQQTKIAIDKFNAEVKANYPGIGQALGRVLNDTIEDLHRIFTGHGKTFRTQK